MEKLSYKLETFEGPLDLLLYLITKNKLDICDIQISELLDQYMEQINAMQEADMDIASEFLEMVARLVYMKTVSLLPKHEEMEALRQELTGQLLEYQECKQVAAQLTERFHYNIYVREPAEVEPDKSYKRHHDPQEILAAYLSATGRGKRVLPPSPQSFSGIVTHRIVSVTSQIVYVLRRLWKVKSIAYESLFVEKREKSDLVATFLAVLELVKGKRVRIEGEGKAATVNLMDGGERHWKSKRSEEQ